MSANNRQVGGSHYKTQFEHWDFVMACNLNYLQGCASKYVARAYKKNGTEDLEKGIHYIEKQMEGGYAIVLHNGQTAHVTRFIKSNDLDGAQARAICHIVAGDWLWAIKSMKECISIASAKLGPRADDGGD